MIYLFSLLFSLIKFMYVRVDTLKFCQELTLLLFLSCEIKIFSQEVFYLFDLYLKCKVIDFALVGFGHADRWLSGNSRIIGAENVHGRYLLKLGIRITSGAGGAA